MYMVAYKYMKHLNRNERETLHINLIAKDKWTEHYRELWYDPNVPQKPAEDLRIDTGVGPLTLEELEGAFSSMKNLKAAGLDGINSKLLKYSSKLLKFRLQHLLNMC